MQLNRNHYSQKVGLLKQYISLINKLNTDNKYKLRFRNSYKNSFIQNSLKTQTKKIQDYNNNKVMVDNYLSK